MGHADGDEPVWESESSATPSVTGHSERSEDFLNALQKGSSFGSSVDPQVDMDSAVAVDETAAHRSHRSTDGDWDPKQMLGGADGDVERVSDLSAAQCDDSSEVFDELQRVSPLGIMPRLDLCSDAAAVPMSPVVDIDTGRQVSCSSDGSQQSSEIPKLACSIEEATASGLDLQLDADLASSSAWKGYGDNWPHTWQGAPSSQVDLGWDPRSASSAALAPVHLARSESSEDATDADLGLDPTSASSTAPPQTNSATNERLLDATNASVNAARDRKSVV